MKNVLFLAHHDRGQEARLQCAFDAVRVLDGHLTCVELLVPRMMPTDFSGGMIDIPLIEQDVEDVRHNTEQLTARIEAEGLPFSWEQVTGLPIDAIEASAPLTDLVITGSEAGIGMGDDLQSIAGHAACLADRPVLAVPPGAKGVNFSGTAVVAWEDTKQSERALRSAIPLLTKASRVVLVHVGEPDDADILRVGSYCSRHGIEVEIVNVPRPSQGVARALLDAAAEYGADWIAMGAYGQSRLRQALFGGVTLSMLKESPVPLLLAH